jgi:quercetin dioxygenase-like cupin family protein
MKTRFIIITGIILFIVAPFGLCAQNHRYNLQKKAEKITDRYILRKLLNEPGIANKEVQMLIVNFPPGSTSPAHRHPCPTFGYVLEGELESQFEGKSHLYKQGSSFYEKPNGIHSITRNNSPLKPAKLLVFFITGKGKSTSVPVKN